MNNSKILMIVAGTLLGACLCVGAAGFVLLRGAGWFLTETVESEVQVVEAAGAVIAEYMLPAGYGDGYAVNVADFSLVMYTAVDGRSHIYLIQAPASLGLDREELERQMRQTSGSDGWTEVSVVEERPCQIRGRASTLVISEGVSHDGSRYRSASALFDGNDGLAMVNVSGPAETWDQAMVDQFIESLK